MEFQNENGADVKNGAAKESTNKTAQGVETKKENGQAAKKENASANGKHEPEKGKETPAANAKPEAVKPEAPKAEEPKKEEAKPAESAKGTEAIAKPVLNLEATLKAVDTLHRKAIQRLNLISRMKELETFEINLAEESDELEDNPYQGCKLIIEDDKRRQFVTVQPGLIRMVAQFIFDACGEKLAEIESGLVFPNA